MTQPQTTDPRLGNIGNILNDGIARRRLPEVSRAARQAAPTVSARPTDEQPQTKQAKPRKTTGTPPKSANTGGLRRVGVRMPVELRDALDDHAHAKKVTRADVVFDAIEQGLRDDALADLVAAEVDKPTVGELFTRSAPVRSGGGTEFVEMRMNAANLQVLDNLKESTKAPSRTAFIVAAVRGYLNAAK